eukprot:jgi/Tetstr1/464230/TSEL_009035.t1
MTKTWADICGDDLSHRILYRVIDPATMSAIDDFSPAMHELCDAVHAAHADHKAAIDRLVGALKEGARLPGAKSNLAFHSALLAMYNESIKRFVMSMRGTLKIIAVTEVHEVRDDKAALERVSRVSQLEDLQRPLDARIKALARSQTEEKRRNADAARRMAREAKARFCRRILCVMYGTHTEESDDQEAWSEASDWARQRLGGGECVMDRMQRVLSEIVRHKRAIDWEIDSQWAYDGASPSRRFVGGAL